MNMKKCELMYARFGTEEGVCADCIHLVGCVRGNKSLYKCEVYGETHSEASDWRKKWKACGLKNKETDIRNVIHWSRNSSFSGEQIDGQIAFGGFNGTV